MTRKLLLIAAIGLGLGLSLASSALSCERHMTHVTIAAAAPAAAVVPVVLPQSKLSDEAAMTVAPEVVTSPRAMGGCQRHRQTTVYLTQ